MLMRISEFIDPNAFQRFCSMLLSAEFSEFQSIDDSGGDLGMDGYTGDKIFQCYCPEKPQKITGKDFKDKIDDSITKATKTIVERKLDVQTFIFVTPTDLRSDVILYLGEKCKEDDLKGLSYGETKLTELLAKHTHVQTQFPFLVLPDLATELKDISRDVKFIKDSVQRATMGGTGEVTESQVLKKNTKLKESIEAYNNGELERFIALSKEVYYETSDDEVKLQSILNIALNDVNLWKVSYHVNLCDEGIELAKRLNSLSTKVVLIAKKANLIQWEADFLLQELWPSEQIAIRIGIFDEPEYLKKQKIYIAK